MEEIHLTCVKTGKKFPFSLNVFNNPEANSQEYTNLILEGGYELSGYQSKVPFHKIYVSFGAGRTPLIDNPKLAEILGVPNLLIKDESYNPYGTHKDRRSEYIVNVAIENHIDKIVCLTAGNAGYSLSRYCSRAGIDYTSLVFPWVSEDRKKSLEEWGKAVTIDGARYNGILRPRDFRQIVEEYDKYERKLNWNHIWAVTNSFEPISINAYKELFYEIKDKNPDYVVVPCGSGDIIIGIWLAIKELGMQTKIIATGPKDEHPLKYALKYGVEEYQVADYIETSLAEKLTTPFTAVLPILYQIFTEPGNIYAEVSNDEIKQAKEIAERNGIKCEYSAATAFATFLSYNRPDIDSSKNIIIVSTGKGLEN